MNVQIDNSKHSKHCRTSETTLLKIRYQNWIKYEEHLFITAEKNVTDVKKVKTTLNMMIMKVLRSMETVKKRLGKTKQRSHLFKAGADLRKQRKKHVESVTPEKTREGRNQNQI